MLLASTVQVGRTAHTGNMQTSVGNFLLGLFKARGPKFGARRQVHRSLQSAKLHCGKAILLGEVENLEPLPRRATECRKTDRQAPARSAQSSRQPSQNHRQALKELPPVRVHHQHQRTLKAIFQYSNLERNTSLTVTQSRSAKRGTTALQPLAGLFSCLPNSAASIPRVCPRPASGFPGSLRNDSRHASTPCTARPNR